MKKQINLKELARIAGVSPSTVSRLLNDEYGVGSEKSERVKKLAKEYGYRPNPIALGLKTRKSFLVGLIVPSIDDEFFSRIFSGMEEVANDTPYNILVTHANDSVDKEERLIRTLLDINVDGFLVSSAQLVLTNNHFELIKEAGKPLVLFDRVNQDYPYSAVSIDNEKGGQLAAEHLLSRGCEDFLYVSFDKSYQNDQQRYDGFASVLGDAGKKPDRIIFKDPSYFEQEFMKLKRVPDGIFCFNDRIAANIMPVVKRKGYGIPDDIKVVGFDNRSLGELTDPSLTTISQHPYDMGRKAFELLYGRLNGENTQKITLPPEVIIREST
jgi:LacI family transcriptional regulator